MSYQNNNDHDKQQEYLKKMEQTSRAIEKATRALEEERKKLDYDRWYSSLSPEAKAIEDRRKETQIRTTFVLCGLLAIALIIGVILIATAESRAIRKGLKTIEKNITEYGDGYTYTTTASQNGNTYNVSIIHQEESDNICFTASYKEGNNEYYGEIRFKYGHLDEAQYYGEIRIDGTHICYIEYSGVYCNSYNNYTLSDPTNVKVRKYESWNEEDTQKATNDKVWHKVWDCVKTAMKQGNQTFTKWNAKLEPW